MFYIDSWLFVSAQQAKVRQYLTLRVRADFCFMGGGGGGAAARRREAGALSDRSRQQKGRENPAFSPMPQ